MSRPAPGERVYRFLLRVYPRDFRETYGDEMALSFRDLVRDARRHGGRAALAGLWVRTLADLIGSALRERRAEMNERYRTPVTVLAVAVGLFIAWVDSSPGWDDTGITVMAMLMVAAAFGGAYPRAAWQWALAVGLWIPLHGIVWSHDFRMAFALLPALIGAYIGAGLRRVIDPRTPAA